MTVANDCDRANRRPTTPPTAANPSAADSEPSLALPSCGVFSNRSMMEEPFFMTDQILLVKFSESAVESKKDLNQVRQLGEIH